MIPISYNARSLMVRKGTTLATGLGIGLVVFVLAAAVMLYNGIKHTMSASGPPDQVIVLRKGSDTELSSSIEVKSIGLALSAPGVKREGNAPLGMGEIAIVITLDKVGAAEGQISNVQVRGVQENVLKVRKDVKVIEGRLPRAGTDEVMVGKSIEGRFVGVKLGGKFELKKNRPVDVVGIFEANGSAFESEVWADLDSVRSAFGREGTVSSITVQLDSPSKFEAFRATLESDKQLDLVASTVPAYFEKQSEGSSVFVISLGVIMALLFSFGAMIGATITMHAAVSQRQREIGTLRALGFSRASIMFSLLLEAILLSLCGGGVGLLAALSLGFVRFSMMNFQTWQEISFSFTPTPGVLLVALVAGVVMGLAGGLFPAVRAARISPIEAMRG